MIKFTPWLLTTFLYSPVFYTLYKSKWDSVDYTHAYFILPLSLLIVWLERARIGTNLKAQIDTNQTRIDTRIWTNGWLVLVIFSLLLFVLGWRNDYMFIQTFSLIPLLFGMTSYLYGRKVTRLLLFPILYLLLLVPPPLGILDSITLPMRYGVSVVSAIILKTMQYPLTREGLLITMGEHEIFMGAPCSGFRSLITMFSLGLIYVYFNKGRFSKNLILIFSIIPLALIGNLIRVLAMCLVTYYFGHEVGQGFYHDFSGMVVFVVMILGLIGMEKVLSCKQ